MRNRFILSTAVALALMVPAVHAQAVKYCEDQVVPNAFYSNVQSDGVRSTVTYFVQLQNQSISPVVYAVKFSAKNVISAQNGTKSILAPWEQITVTLGSQKFDNPSGTGQLSQSDMMRFTKVECPPKQ